ncbi:MAG TPA: thiamine ABC transporter substrate-binding protein [Acidimicrobiia bacterium]|nr:thiamine ABC transporter substrate-binding protein [Acidimicrobiia bacterium]
MTTGRIITLIISLALLAACNPDDTAGTSSPPPPDELTIISHDSFVDGVTDETFAAFTEDTDIEVEALAAGDAGGAVNQAILTKDNPIADVLFGVDSTFLSRALDEDLFVPYESERLDSVLPGLRIDDQHRVTPIDYGDVCLNYDIAWFEENGLEPPASLDDLVAPEYADLLVVEDPAASSPGLAFLLATTQRYGSDWPGYWESLVANDVEVAPDWDTAYYADFTRYDGDNPIVVSYASSPPAEVMFADPPVDTAPTGVVTDGCYRQIEFAGILSGTPHAEAAGELIDFMLSPEFQETIPTTWFVFPANAEVELPDVFAENTVIPEDPIAIAPAEIAENRDEWLGTWRRVVAP